MESTFLLSGVKGTDDDLATYGDSFVAEIHYGGIFTAHVTLTAKENEDIQDIAAKFKGVLNTASVNAQLTAEVEKKENEAMSNQRIEVTLDIKGSTLKGLLPTTVGELIKAVKDFPSSVGSFSVPYCFYTTSYSDIAPFASPLLNSIQSYIETTMSSTFFELQSAYEAIEVYDDFDILKRWSETETQAFLDLKQLIASKTTQITQYIVERAATYADLKLPPAIDT